MSGVLQTHLHKDILHKAKKLSSTLGDHDNHNIWTQGKADKVDKNRLEKNPWWIMIKAQCQH